MHCSTLSAQGEEAGLPCTRSRSSESPLPNVPDVAGEEPYGSNVHSPGTA